MHTNGLWDTVSSWVGGGASAIGGAFDTAQASLNNALNDLSGQMQTWSQEWEDAKNNLMMKAQEFTRLFNDLQSKASQVPPELKAQYDALMNKGNWVKSTIQNVTNGIDFGWNLFSNSPTMSGIFKRIGGLNGMGLLPLVPIAVIFGAVAVMVAWIADAYSMQQKISLARSTGANANQAATIIGQGSSGSVVTSVGNFAKSAGVLLVIGGVVFVFRDKIKKALKL